MVSTVLSDHYESLRDDVVSGTTIGSRRWGWNLLLTRGLAAWMSAWSVELAGSTSSPGLIAQFHYVGPRRHPAARIVATTNDFDAGGDDPAVTFPSRMSRVPSHH